MKKMYLLISFSLFTIFAFSLSLEMKNQSIVITGDFILEEIKTISHAKEKSHLLSVNDCSQSGANGQAELPIYSQLIQLPESGNYYVSSFSYEQKEIKLSYPLAAWGREDNLQKNNLWQSGDKWLHEEMVTIDDPAIMRGIRFCQLNIHPVQYNPAKQSIRILQNIHLEISIDESDRTNEIKSKQNRTTKAFSEIAASQIFGYQPPRIITDSSYLIIIPDGYESNITDLVKWKQKLGYKVTVATTSQTGSTNVEINNYLQNAYDTWENPFDYVLLIGDVTGNIVVPSNYVDGYYPPGSADVSDHPYTLLEGDDYFPDILIGRFSVLSPSELQTIVQKIIYYESNPYTNIDWFDKALMITYVSTDWGGYTSSRETKMAVRDKLLNYHYTAVDTFFSPYQASPVALQNKINQGYSFLNYRGFGGPNYWYEPFFTSDNVNSLNNGFLLPMVTSMTCGGGDFAATEYASCFGETWLKAGSISNFKGAIGFIGPSERDTKTQFNNSNDMGIYQGITQENLLRCGQMLLRGKMELYKNYPTMHGWGGSLNSVQFYFYVYNLLGDPGLSIWTTQPQEISFSMTGNMTTAHNFMEVEITSFCDSKENFVVAITNGDELLYRMETDELGKAIFPVDLTEGDYQLTVSKQGFVPETELFSVTELNQLQLLSVQMDAQPICGESIQLSVLCKNSSENVYSSLQFTLSSSDSLIVITDSQEAIDSLSPQEEIALTFQFDVNELWLEGNLINLFVKAETEEMEQNFIIPITTDAPEIIIQEIVIDNEYLEQGTENLVWLNLQNTGSAQTGNMSVELISRNLDSATINQSFADFGSIASGEIETQDVPFEILVSDDIISGETLFFHLNFYRDDELVFELPFTLTVGSIDETSPTFSEYGYMAIECRDEGNFPPVEFSWIELNPQYGGNGDYLMPDHSTADGYSSFVELPFDFTYFGKEYNRMYVCSQGYISMGDSDLVFHRNRYIPSGSGPIAMIAPFWDDLTSGNLFYQNFPDQHYCVIQWAKMRNVYYPNYFETFQVILYDPLYYPSYSGDGLIKFQYMDINNVDSGDNYATVGIENEAKTSGLLLTFSDIYHETAHPLQNQTAILFTTGNDPIVFNDNDVISNSEMLWQNYPNPFNPVTTISYTINKEQDVNISIFNIKGQKIRTLIAEKKQAGTHHIQWDGTDDKQQAVSSGIYLYQLKTNNKETTKRMLLLK